MRIVLMFGCAAVIPFMASPVNAQMLDSGYLVTPLATLSRGNTFGDDLHIVDMNDSGQVMVDSGLVVGGGAFVDTKLRVDFTAPTNFLAGGSPTAPHASNSIGATNLGELAVGSKSYGNSFLSPYFFPAILGPDIGFAIGCQTLSSCDVQHFDLDSYIPIELGGSEALPSKLSVNQATGKVIYSRRHDSEIWRFDHGENIRLIGLQDVPAEFQAFGAFQGFLDGRETGTINGGGTVLRLFNDDHFAFVLLEAVTGRTRVFEADSAQNIWELYEFPTQIYPFAINEDRQIAWVCPINSICPSLPGVYFQDQIGPRLIYPFTMDSYEAVQFLAINDLGQVAFEVFNVTTHPDGIRGFSIYLYDSEAGDLTPLATDSPPPFPGDASQFYTSLRLDSWSLNDAGQFALAVHEPRSQQYVAGLEPREFYRFDPPGTSTSNPLLPGEECDPDRFCFRFPVRGNCAYDKDQKPVWCRPISIDPVVAIGYNYEARNESTRFLSVTLPLVGDGIFDLFVWDAAKSKYVDSGVDIHADEPYVFAWNGIPEGVSRFSIRGIEVSSDLDPEDFRAFVTTLSFANPGIQELEMTPIRFDTTPRQGDIDQDGDIDMDDVNLISARRNLPANAAGDPMDLDGDGMISALDARKAALLCTRPRCAVL